jgi:hypothetical protein
MKRKYCTNCGEYKLVTDFNFRNRSRGMRSSRCKVCTRAGTKAAYYANRSYYLKRIAERNRVLIPVKQRYLYEYLEHHPCLDCGEQDPTVLQFDHVRGKKQWAIAEMVHRRMSLKATINEISKCDIRCANCHARRTAAERGYYTYLNELD